MQICQAAEATERQLNKLHSSYSKLLSRKGSSICGEKIQYNKHKYSENKIKLKMDIVESVVGIMNQENVLLMEENVTSAVNLIILLDIVQVHTVEEDDYVFVGVIKNQEIKVNNW